MAWPETGVWYDAKVLEVDAKARTATIFYPDSLGEDAEHGEREELNLEEAILDDEVSWPVFRDEAHAAEVMARRAVWETRANKRAKPAEKRAAEKRAEELAEEGKIRQKVRASVEAALETAAAEALESGHERAEGTPSEVATAVEAALYAKCGSVDKDYRTRARSLMFNLKDAHNRQLRARVLANDLRPEKVAGMSPQELANKELVEWREARQRAAGEDAFVKGVALEDLVVKKDGKNEIHVEIKQDEPLARENVVEQIPATERDTAPATTTAIAAPEEMEKEEEPEDEPRTTTTTTTTAAGETESEFVSFEHFANGDEEDDEDEDEDEDEEERDEPEYEPEPAYRAEDDGDQEYEPEAPSEVPDDDEYDPENGVEDVREDIPLPDGAWEGTIEIHGMPTLRVRCAPIGGEGAPVGDLMPESLVVKGRVDYKSMQSFVKQVHRSSTSRAVTLVHVSPAPSGGDDAEAALAKLIKHYRERQRCGVAKSDDIELYLAPRGQHADKVITTVELTPGHVPPSAGMIGMMIHPRGLGPNSKDVRRAAAREEPPSRHHLVDVPPPPPPPIAPAHHASYETPHVREVPPPPPPPVAFQAQDLQNLISNAGALFGGAGQPPLINVPPPPPGSSGRDR